MGMLLGIFLTCSVAVLTWYVIKFIRKYIMWCRLLTSANIQLLGKTHPIWGHLHLISNSDDVYKLLMVRIEETNAKLFGAWTGFMYPVFFVVHPDTVKIIMNSSEPKPTHPGSGYNVVIPWIGEGLLISKGKKWERNRRLLTPAFHFDILKNYVKVYNEVADLLLDKFTKVSDSDTSIEIYDPVSLATFDTMLRCAFSYEGNVQAGGSKHPYVNAVKTLTFLASQRTLKPWQYLYPLFRIQPSGRLFTKLASYVHRFDEQIIHNRKRTISKDASVLQTKKRLDFLDILLTARDENGVGLTAREIRDEVDTFLFEGHDTTASAITWAIYALAKHQEEQEMVCKEVSAILIDKEDVEWTDLSDFKYLSLFIKESMRYYSPVPGVSRVLTKEVNIDGTIIPKNLEIIIPIYAIHHNPNVWNDPEKFDPQRFSEPDIRTRDPYSFVPFSAGPRNCIGQHFALDEIKVILAKVVKKFHITCDPKREATPMADVVMRSDQQGVYLNFHKRV